MDGSPIPKKQKFAGQMPVQLEKEIDHLWAADRPVVQFEIKVTQGQSSDCGYTLPIKIKGQNRSLSAGRPSARPVRSLTQTAFIEEDDCAAFPPGFFLRRGQSWLFH